MGRAPGSIPAKGQFSKTSVLAEPANVGIDEFDQFICGLLKVRAVTGKTCGMRAKGKGGLTDRSLD
jgi:hypothetical protein